MRFLYPGGGVTGAYGIITAPNHKGIPVDIVNGKPWAGDLGCADGPEYVKRINWAALPGWLEVMAQYKGKCLFISGGDVMGNAAATLATYRAFEVAYQGWPLAYVAQNGAEDLPIPRSCAAVFIAGDTRWKESMAAVSVIKRAQSAGKHIHIGRVNWGRRYRLFSQLSGSENFTCDGTRTRYDGREKTIAAWLGYQSQPPLITL